MRDESNEVGSIVMPPPPGERFALAGRTWEVVEIDTKRKTVFATQVRGKVPASWFGSGGSIHTRVLQRMRQVLLETEVYPYLQRGARERLQDARRVARYSGLDQTMILGLGGDTYCVFPWLGSVGCRTLERCLRFVCKEALGVRSIEGLTPYFLVLSMSKGDSDALRRALIDAFQSGISGETLLGPKEAPQTQKYDEFVPAHLLRKAYSVDFLDIDEVRKTFGKE